MQSFHPSQNLFDGNGISFGEEISFHTIVTDHPYMHQIGLGVFTTGTLYQWLNTRDSSNSFINMKLINGLDPSPIILPFPIKSQVDKDFLDRQTEIKIHESMRKILHSIQSVGDVYSFSAWRPKDKGGEYVKFSGKTQGGVDSFSKWVYDDGIKYKSWDNFNHADLEFSNLDNQKVNNVIGEATQVTTTNQNNFDTFISNIIEMNNWVRMANSLSESEGIVPGYWNQLHWSRYHFITDIKSSKEKSIQWSVDIPFILDLNTQKCLKTEKVNFKLFLYDDTRPKKSARKIAINSTTIVAPKIDAFGRQGTKIDGEWIPPSLDFNPNNSVAAEMSLEYVPLEGKWQSGTPQVLAQIVTDIEAAEPVNLSDNLSKSTSSLLESTSQHKIVTGSAIPIIMQNGNPLQWSPEYKLDKSCRADSNDKFMIKIFNPFPRTWASGDIVLLNKINGVWIPSSYGEQVKETPTPQALDNIQWEFTYFMTNCDFYFRDKNKNVLQTSSYENAVRSLFYYGDSLNNGATANNVDSFKNIIDISPGYFQITSFDFMGENIGGLRTKNALACTQFAFKPNGEALENNGEFLPGVQSAPFFGCVFPDGYNPGDKFELYNTESLASRDVFAQYTHAIDNTNVFFKEIPNNKNIFKNSNANNSSAAADGMFITVAQGDSTLKHLPADIALNASRENAIYGGPITDIHYLHTKLNTFTNVDNYKNNLYNVLTSGHLWMASKPPAGTNDPSSYYLKSTFDFQPINPKKIQFRPLKAEVYATFEHRDISTVNSQVPNASREFGAFSWKLVNDNQCPIALYTLPRNNTNNPLVNSWGLKYHTSITNSDGSVSNTLPPSTAKFPQTWWWRRGWQVLDTAPQYNPPRPAGGLGVITARCTVSAVNSITFNTTNYLGITSWLGPSNIIWNRPWYASWGGYGGEQINSMQTTSLFAKIYHAWPREQTLFDPRFFAVFHFNSNSNDLNVKIPTMYDPGTERIPVGNYILSDYTINSSLSNKKQVVDLDYWTVFILRKKQLLPYSYEVETISFNLDEVWNSELSPLPTKPALTKNFDIYIVSMGKKYTVNDVFTVSGGNGISVKLRPKIKDPQLGDIYGFEFIDTDIPYGYIASDFPKMLDNNGNDINFIDNQQSLQLRIIPVSSAGEGFKGYIVRGIVKKRKFTDEAPKLVTQLLPLTPYSNAQSSQSEKIIDPTTGSREESVILNSSNSSSDQKYDIFLHFHNDISHTMCNDFNGGGPLALENHSTLEISVG